MSPENQKKQAFHAARKTTLSWQTFSAIAHDIFAALLALIMVYLLRFNFKIPAEFMSSIWRLALLAIPLQVFIFIKFGLYRGIWRFASMLDLRRILMAVATASIIIVALLFMFKPMLMAVPRSVLVMYPILLVLFMGGSRLAYRSWKEYKLYGPNGRLGTPVVLLGAGEAAISLLKDLARSEEWRVIGLLDDDNTLHGRELLGVKVLGNIVQLTELAARFEVSHAIIAMPSAAHQSRRRALEIAKQSELTVLTVPAFDDLMSGKVRVSQIRHIEVEDLLGREVVTLDDNGLHTLIEHKVVFVSGAGGSIGSELCRQIIKYKPKQLICFDISEFSLYQLEQELLGDFHAVELIFVTGDVKNAQRVQQLLSAYQPKVVFHAAAYKHVPLMETHNVAEALANNVLGTYTLASASMLVGVEKFVLISTDKAVNPTNVMGASKRLAEMVCQSLEGSAQSKTHFVMVRFGNVLGSSGSVIPKFREQIASGGPVTVTHPEITRYFMSIPEAAQLVMQAGLMGEDGEIFVLDMGEAVKIAELAKDMIRLSGFHHDEIKIAYSGLRPGEKLYEELLADDEQTLPTPHPKLRIASARKADAAWVEALLKWVESCQTEDELVIKKQLATWVEEYVQNPPIKAVSNVVPLRKTVR
jgi:FlaA1/EpsC-like NDP-sugar epimerase